MPAKTADIEPDCTLKLVALKVPFPIEPLTKLNTPVAREEAPRSSVAPLTFSKPVVSEPTPANCKSPACKSIKPDNTLAALKVTVPVPVLVNVPDPLNTVVTTPDCAAILAAVKVPPVMLPPLKLRAPTVCVVVPSASSPALTFTEPPDSAPVTPRLNVPPFTFVPPTYVLAPESVTLSAPVLVTLPEPVKTAEIDPDCKLKLVPLSVPLRRRPPLRDITETVSVKPPKSSVPPFKLSVPPGNVVLESKSEPLETVVAPV